MTKIICINGFKRSGKGETGKAIEAVTKDRYRHTVQLGFADKLKVAACRNLGLLNLSDAEAIAYMDRFKEKGLIEFWLSDGRDPEVVDEGVPHLISGRKYLQWMGTEYRKLFGEDFWVDQVLPKPLRGVAARRGHGIGGRGKWYPGADYVAFTDCRFPNEAKRCLDLGGEVWEVIHPDAASDGHASEIPLPRELVTRQIINDGTLQDLRYNVEKALAL